MYLNWFHLRNIFRNIGNGFTDEQELVLETMKKGKVILNKINLSDSSCSQLWRFTKDGCLENIAMNNRAKPGERYVLDVLEKGGFVLMVVKRNSARDRFQKWHLTPVICLLFPFNFIFFIFLFRYILISIYYFFSFFRF